MRRCPSRSAGASIRSARARARVGAAAVLAIVVGAGCAGEDRGDGHGFGASIEVSDARMARPIAAEAAAYLTIRNTGPDDDRLVAATSSRASAVVVHRSLVDASGQVTMDDGNGLPVASGQTVRLRPGADHLMVVGADDLRVGDQLPLVLRFATAGDVAVKVRVVRLVEPDAAP